MNKEQRDRMRRIDKLHTRSFRALMLSIIIYVIVVPLALSGCSSGGGSRPIIKPQEPPVATEPTPQNEVGVIPSVVSQAIWSYEVNGKLDIAKVLKLAHLVNTLTIKRRWVDSGDYGALVALAKERGWKVIAIAQGGNEEFYKDLAFLLDLQQRFGSDAVGAFIWYDEPDLSRSHYLPSKIDEYADKLRAEGVTIPLYINLSVAVGLSDKFNKIGIDLIRERGVPTRVNLGLEGYWITEPRYRQTMSKAILEVCRMAPASASFAVIGTAWCDYNQPCPDFNIIWVSMEAWSTWPEFAPFKNRLKLYVQYRGSTDPGAGDCFKGLEDLPDAQRAVLRFKVINNL